MERAALTGGMLLAVLALYALMLRGWRSRQRRQSDLPAPPVPPAEPGEVLVDAVSGLFVGTTTAEDWLDRIAVHDLASRAAGFLLVDTDGLHVEREGLPELYLPWSHVEAVTVGDALAGKVVGPGGLLLVDWQLGERRLTSGFRADDHDAHRRIAETVAPRLAAHRTTHEPPTSGSTARLDLEAP